MTMLWKRSLSMFMALALVFGMLPAGAIATELETEPAVTEPETVVTEPAVTEPAATEPAVTEPVVTEPVVSEPVSTQPETTESEDDDTPVKETVEVSLEPADSQETESAESAETEPEELVLQEISVLPSVTPELSDEELFATYANAVIYGNSISYFGTSGRDLLSGNALEAYNALRPALEEIAAGKRETSVITIGYEVGQYKPEFSANLTGTEFTQEDLQLTLNALLTDMPYELYWMAKGVPIPIGYVDSNEKLYVEFYFPVSAFYSASSSAGANDPDKTKTGAAAATAAKAEEIASVTGMTDYEKLLYFKDYICEQVSYNESSGSYAQNSNPWQIIYIFDDDPTTNVVCEGYAKAFKRLCDLADFADDSIRCETVSGYTNGPHMWNIVTIDGSSYMVDVTNSDEGMIGQDGSFFLAGAAGSIADGYTFSNNHGQTLHYAYSYEDDGELIQASILTFGSGEDSILNLAEEDYAVEFSQKDLEAALKATVDGRYIIPESVTLSKDMVLDVTRTQEELFYPVYLPEGVTLTVPSGVTLTANAPVTISGGVLDIEDGATVIVNFGLYVQSGGTLNIADSATLSVSDNAGITLILGENATINGTVDELTAESNVSTEEELAEALTVPVGGESIYAYHNIIIANSFTIEEDMTIPAGQFIFLNYGSTLTVGTVEKPVTLTNEGMIVVPSQTVLTVASGSELVNNGSMFNNGGSVTGNITGNAISINQGSDVVVDEEIFIEMMENAAKSDDYINVTISNDLTLTKEIIIPDNTSIYFDRGVTLTIAETSVLTNQGVLYAINGSYLIEGVLDNQGELTLDERAQNAYIQVSESGNLINNGDIFVRSGSITVNGAYEGGEYCSLNILMNIPFEGISESGIDLYAIVETEDELHEAIEMPFGEYNDHSIYIDEGITFTQHLVVPEYIFVSFGYSYDPDRPFPQCYFTIPSGVSLTIEGSAHLSDFACLTIEPGAELIVDVSFGGGGICVNNGKFASEYVYLEDTELTQNEFTEGMALSVENEADYYLRQTVVLEDDTTLTSGAMFNMVDGGRIEVPSGVTLTVDAATDLIGGQLVVYPGGKLVLNDGLTVKRGTLYVPDDAALENDGNLNGRRTFGADEEPYLSGYWVHDWGEGFFMNDEVYWETRDARFAPGTQFDHIFYLNVFNAETLSWDQTPVSPYWLNTSGYITLEYMNDNDWFTVKDGEPNSDYFVTVKIADSEDAWDTTGYVSYNHNGTELKYAIYHSRDEEMGFYAAAEANNDNWLNGYTIDAAAEENSFYFIFHDLDYIQSVENIALTKGADKVSMEHVSGNTYRITLNPEAMTTRDSFEIVVKVNATYTDGSAYEQERSFWIEPFRIDDSAITARFEINGQWYLYVPTLDAYVTYTDHGMEFVELPEGVTYLASDNEMTLTNASLSSLRVGYYWRDEYGNRVEGADLPNEYFKLKLEDENTITCDYDHALVFHDGVNAEIYGSGSLHVKTIAVDGRLDDEGYALAWDAVNLWCDSSLTISGDATVTAEVEGTGHHENGEQAFLAAVRLGGGDLTLTDNASLTTVLPADARKSGDTLITDEWGNTYYGGGYTGVEMVGTLTVDGNATLNTQELYVENYYQYAGNVMITSTGNKYYGDYYEWDDETHQDVFIDQRDGYYYDGLCTRTGTIEISGGELTINVLPTEEEHNVRSGFSGLSSEGGTITISNDAVVNINGAYDGSGIVAACALDEDGNWTDIGSKLEILGGEVNFTGTIPDFWPHAIDVYPVSEAEFNGGTINATLGKFAIGGIATWKRTVLNGTDIIFAMDNEFTMTSGEMNLDTMSLVEVNGGATISGNSVLYMENSAFVVNGGCALEGDAVIEMYQDDTDLNDFSLLVNGYLSVSKGVDILIDQTSFNESRLMTPVVVNGTFHMMGGHVEVYMGESEGPAFVSGGKTLINDGTLTIEGNRIGIVQGYDFDRPADDASLFYVSGGSVDVSSDFIGILVNGPVDLQGGSVSAFAQCAADNTNKSWPQAVLVQKQTGNADLTGENVSSLNISGGRHNFIARDSSDSEACSKALVLDNAPVTVTGGFVHLIAEMALYSVSDSLENTNVYGNVKVSSVTTDEELEIQSRELTETAEIEDDYFHTLLEADGTYATDVNFISEMTAEAFVAAMNEAAENGVALELDCPILIDQEVELTCNVVLKEHANLTVEDGGVLVIPENHELVLLQRAVLDVLSGGVVVNMGVLYNQFGEIHVADMTEVPGYYQSGLDSEDEPQAELLILAGEELIPRVEDIPMDYQTLVFRNPLKDDVGSLLNGGFAEYRHTKVYYNQDLHLEDGLNINYNATLYFGGNEDYQPTLTIDGDSYCSIEGELVTNYANVIINCDIYSYTPEITFNHTKITINSSGSLNNYMGNVFLNNDSLMIVHGALNNGGDPDSGTIHVGYWKDPDVEGPAGTINIADGGVLQNDADMYIWENGVVNVNGTFNNFLGFSPRTVGPADGDIVSNLYVKGTLNVSGTLNNDTNIIMESDSGETVMTVYSGANLVNTENAVLANRSTGTFLAKEGSTVENTGKIISASGTMDIQGEYTESDEAKLLAGYRILENGSEEIYRIDSIPVDQQTLYYEMIEEFIEDSVAECPEDQVVGLIAAVKRDGYAGGLITLHNAMLTFTDDIDIPENITFELGDISYESSAELCIEEGTKVILRGKVDAAWGSQFVNYGYLEAWNANIKLSDGEMINNGTALLNGTNVANEEYYYGSLVNDGNLEINDGSLVQVMTVNNAGNLHVAAYASEDNEENPGTLRILGDIENRGYLCVHPGGELSMENAYVMNYNDEEGCGYIDVHGTMVIDGGWVENYGLMSSGTEENLSVIEVTGECTFNNHETAMVGCSANGSITFGEATLLYNSGLIENAGGEMAILGSYEAEENAVARVHFMVDESGETLATIDGLSADQLTVYHLIHPGYASHDEDTIRRAMNIAMEEGYAQLCVEVQDTNLDIASQLNIPGNMTLNIGGYDATYTSSVTVLKDAFLYNGGMVNILDGGSLIVNGVIGQGSALTSEFSGEIVINEGGSLNTLFEGAVTISGENASVVNNGLMSGPAEILGAYTHGAGAYIGGGYVVYEDGTVEIKEAVGPDLPNSIKSLNHSITVDYPAHGEDTARAYLEYVQANGYADGSLNILPDSALNVTDDLSVPSNVAIQVYGTLNLASGVKLEAAGDVTNNGTIDLDANAAITVAAEAANNGTVQGSCGDSMNWNLKNGVLTFTGSGDMINYTNVADIPWNFLADTITEIRFTGNAPAISENAFTGVTATAYYPAGDSSWTEVTGKNYGGSITWMGEAAEPTYKFGQTVQIKLIEPWGLKANARVYTDGVNNIDYSTIADYGVYFIRGSQLDREGLTQDTVTVEDIILDPDAVHMSRDNGAEVSGSVITAIYDRDIYTYELSDPVFVLFYVVTREGMEPQYAPIRERNLQSLVATRKNDTSFGEKERIVYAYMEQMEADITDYRSDFDSLSEVELQKAPTLGEYPLGASAGISRYSFGHTVQIKLIEPWGMKVNARAYTAETPSGGSIDYSSVEDYGAVVLLDNEGSYSTPEELLAQENAYVFSSRNGDMDVSGTNMSAIYSKDIYTYQLDTDAYVMFYVKDADGYHYGPVRVRNLYDLMNTRKDDTTGSFGEKERAVYADMVNLYHAITDYRADYLG